MSQEKRGHSPEVRSGLVRAITSVLQEGQRPWLPVAGTARTLDQEEVLLVNYEE